MKRRLGQATLVVALVALALWLRGRGGPETPEAAVQAWYDAVARGDDRAVLALTAGPLRESLESSRRQQGADAFRASLRSSVQGLKGIAVSRTAEDEAGDTRVVLAVELVFAARNERQRATVEAAPRGWCIAAFGTAEGAKPPIPYGTPVDE